jgi:hypothetical protein
MRYATAILKCPTGVYAIVGSVPAPLVRKHWATESEAIDALLELGVERFQRADCSWYSPSQSQRPLLTGLNCLPGQQDLFTTNESK